MPQPRGRLDTTLQHERLCSAGRGLTPPLAPPACRAFPSCRGPPPAPPSRVARPAAVWRAHARGVSTPHARARRRSRPRQALCRAPRLRRGACLLLLLLLLVLLLVVRHLRVARHGLRQLRLEWLELRKDVRAAARVGLHPLLRDARAVHAAREQHGGATRCEAGAAAGAGWLTTLPEKAGPGCAVSAAGRGACLGEVQRRALRLCLGARHDAQAAGSAHARRSPERRSRAQQRRHRAACAARGATAVAARSAQRRRQQRTRRCERVSLHHDASTRGGRGSTLTAAVPPRASAAAARATRASLERFASIVAPR